MKIKILLCIVFLLETGAGIAQNIAGRTLPQAANSPAEAKFQSSPENIFNVDLYTGTAGVTIPIYDYSVDGLDLGISLGYTAKGIKVDETSSSVGLGWSLQYGVSLNRIPYGLEDEVQFLPSTSITPTPLNLYPPNGYWTEFNPGNPQYNYDREPDVFVCNLGKSTFRFSIQAGNNRIATYPKSEIKILKEFMDPQTGQIMPWVYGLYSGGVIKFGEFLGVEMDDPYITFIIVDEEGNRFEFVRGDVRKKEIANMPNTNQSFYWATETWNIKRIVTFSGIEIKYNYATRYTEYPLARIDSALEFTVQSTDIVIPDSYTEVWKGYKTHIESIEYPNGVKAIFNLNDPQQQQRCDVRVGDFSLGSITIASEFDHNIGNSLKYVFQQSYFHTPGGSHQQPELPITTPCTDIENTLGDDDGDFSTRLKLNGILEVGSDNVSEEQYYSFQYEEAYPLPVKGSFSQDYYGYYNGESSTPLHYNGIDYFLGIPLHTFGSKTYGVDRKNSFSHAKAATLKSLTNRTGGKIEFLFDEHFLYNPQCSYRTHTYYPHASSSMGGLPQSSCTVDPDLDGENANDGLRIHKILLQDGFNSDNNVVYEYNYNDGQRFFMGGYFWKPTFVLKGQSLHDNHSVLQKVYYNYFLNPHILINGSNHGYSEVTVRKLGYLSEQLSKAKYTFSNLMRPNPINQLFDQSYLTSNNVQLHTNSNLMVNTGLYYHTASAYNFSQHFMGILMKEEHYDKSNNKISDVINTYDKNSTYDYDANTNQPITVVFPSSQGGLIYDEFCLTGSSSTCINNRRTMYDVYFINDVLPHEKVRLKRRITNSFSGGVTQTMEYLYNYDVWDNITDITWKDSKGYTYRKEYIYMNRNSYPYKLSGCLPLITQYKLGERLIKVDVNNSANNRIIDQSIVTPHVTEIIAPRGPSQTVQPLWNNCRVEFPKNYKASFLTPVTAPVGPTSDELLALDGADGLSSLLRVKEYVMSGRANIPATVYFNETDNKKGMIYDPIGRKTAEATNATLTEIAYSSFEQPNLSYGDQSINYDPTKVVNSTPGNLSFTGKSHLEINNTDQPVESGIWLVPGKKYIISIWADKMPSLYFASNPSSLFNPTLAYVSTTGWKLYVKEVVGDGTAIGITSFSGFTVKLDEVRIHPIDAMMTSYTYEPLFGISSVNDNRNNVAKFEYDAHGRLSITRDRNNYIVSKSLYNLQNHDN